METCTKGGTREEGKRQRVQKSKTMSAASERGTEARERGRCEAVSDPLTHTRTHSPPLSLSHTHTQRERVCEREKEKEREREREHLPKYVLLAWAEECT
jgi:hypothetical protein